MSVSGASPWDFLDADTQNPFRKAPPIEEVPFERDLTGRSSNVGNFQSVVGHLDFATTPLTGERREEGVALRLVELVGGVVRLIGMPVGLRSLQ